MEISSKTRSQMQRIQKLTGYSLVKICAMINEYADITGESPEATIEYMLGLASDGHFDHAEDLRRGRHLVSEAIAAAEAALSSCMIADKGGDLSKALWNLELVLQKIEEEIGEAKDAGAAHAWADEGYKLAVAGGTQPADEEK